MKVILFKTLSKLAYILTTWLGWATGIALFIAEYFAGHKAIMWLVILVTFMDAAWGIAVSLKQGKFTKSELARLTINKLLVYGSVMFVFVSLDKIIDSTITASVVGTGITLVELWSSCASMLILYPHIAFLRLLKKALTGEIASKLGIDESEVEAVLAEMHKQQSKPKVNDEQVKEARKRAKREKK